MKEIFKKNGFVIFIVIACLQLIAIQFHYPLLRFITKPILMPILAMIVYTRSKQVSRSYIIAGLFFSFLGDCFLLLEDRHPLFFISGLVSFLVTHILYIIFFQYRKRLNTSFLKSHPYIPLIVGIYGAGLVYLMYPSLGALRIPVIFYAAIICLMLVCSFHFFKSVDPAAGKLFVLGALLFVISDSILAINKFYQPVPGADFLIMLTYCVAQYVIVIGFLCHEKSLPSVIA